MRIAPETAEKIVELVMDHRMARNGRDELILLLPVRQLAGQQQVADFEEIAMLGELLDRIAAIEQHAGIAVDIGNRGTTACSGKETWIVSKFSSLAEQGADIDHIRSDRAAENGKFDGLDTIVE